MPPDVQDVFLPLDQIVAQPVVYRPHLLASTRLRITDRASGLISDERRTYLLTLNDATVQMPDFGAAQMLAGFDIATLQRDPTPDAGFEPLPTGISARWLKDAQKALVEHVYRHATTTVWRNRTLKMYGKTGETQREFRERCELAAKQLRDADATKVRAQFERRMATLQDKLAREQRELTADRADLDARKREEMLTNAESVFNFVIGRSRRGTGRSVAWGATKHRQTRAAEEDVRESEAVIAQLSADLQQVAVEYRAALDALNTRWMSVLADVEQLPLAPKKSDIYADLVTVAWVAG